MNEANQEREHKTACCRSWTCGWICIFCMAVVSLGVGIALPAFLQHIVDAGIRSGGVIDSAKADGYRHFVNATYMSDNRFIVTFFNISNARDVLDYPDIKPQLHEIGPFVYTYYRNRTNVEFTDDGNKMSFNQHQRLEFNVAETLAQTNGKYNSDIGVNITTMNMIFNGMRIQTGRSYWHLISDTLLWKDDYDRLFEHRTPRELLQGYSVEIDILGFKVPISYPGMYPNLPVSKDPDMTKKSQLITGKQTMDDVFQYSSWRNQTEVKVPCPFASMHLPGDEQCKDYPYPCCGQKEPVYVWDPKRADGEFDANANAITGTPGDQFRPGLHADREQVQVFFDLAQRVMAMVTTPGEDTFDYQGVHLRKMRPDRTLVWGNATERPANARYYQWGPGGLMNLTMVFGAQVFVSLPHFLNCEQSLVDAFQGLVPDQDLHDLYIGVEPYSGFTIVEQERAMLSVQAKAEPSVPGLDKGWFPTLGNRTLYVPIAWFNQQSLSTREGTDQLGSVYMALMVKATAKWLGLALGIISVIASAVVGVAMKRRRSARGDSRQGKRTSSATSDGLLQVNASP